MIHPRAYSPALALVFCVLASPLYSQVPQPYDDETRRRALEQFRQEQKAELDLAAKLPQPDRDMATRVPRTYPRPQSAWRTEEKALYQRILAKGRFDTLVVPFQVQEHAFARDIRSLMTAELAWAITLASGGKASLPDPYLVARALGEERRYELTDVFRLADELKVRRLILGYVGHNGKNEMRLTLHYYDKPADVSSWERLAPSRGKYVQQIASPALHSRHVGPLKYSDVETPIDAYHRELPTLVQFLGLDASRLRVAAPSRFEPGALPASPLAMMSGAPQAARDAYYLQLLAVLAPASAERLRERLVEKSLLAVGSMSSASPDYRALKARALMGLGLRPAALQALGAASTPEEKHLLGMLNGDLPQVQAAKRSIAPGVRALLASLEANSMAAAYGVRDERASLDLLAAQRLPGEVWSALAARAMTDADSWTQHENIAVKALLDREFPVKGYSAEAMLQGAAALGDVSKIQAAADLSVHEHARRVVSGTEAKWCCVSLAGRPTTMDYLDLLEAIGTDNLLRRVRFFNQAQGRPQDALLYLSRIESVYKDHPQFTLGAAYAQMALAANAQGTERDGLLRGAYAGAFNAWYWEQGQTRTAADALEDVVTRAGREDYGAIDNFYANDRPFRSFYPYWQLPQTYGVWMRNAREGLQNSAFDFTPVTRMEWMLGQVRKEWQEVDQLLASIDQRFVGHPERVKLLAQSSLRQDDFVATENRYREAIRRQPGEERLYRELGILLFENAADEKASEVFASYPALKAPSSAHPVGLSNYAYAAGSLYYWIGDFARATPLYRIAAELDTGSVSSIASATRLRLMEGDLAGALAGSLERARRYNSPHAYRDYLGLLHATGQSRQAWDGFRALVPTDSPQAWETALVGHRREGASEAQVGAWAAQEPMRSAGTKMGYAAMYVLRAGITDRVPSSGLPALISAVERPVWQMENEYRQVARENGAGPGHAVLGPNSPAEATLPRGVLESVKKVRVKSDLVYMAEAYAALRGGKFGAARSALQEAAALYDTRKESLGYLLPYYAFAAARSKETGSVEALLEKFSSQYRRFDYYLAKAVIAGIGGKHDEAMRQAQLALHRRPFTEQRPIYTEYQFAELCEWLFEATQEPRYRALALDWARKNQVQQPWFSWAYSIEAKLSSDPQARRRAMAMTHYLDPGSERLARLPQNEVKAAVQEFANRNPFVRPVRGEKEKA